MNTIEYTNYLKNIYQHINTIANADNIICIELRIIPDNKYAINHCEVYLKKIDFKVFNTYFNKKRLIMYSNQSFPLVLFNPSFNKFYKSFTDLIIPIIFKKD